MPNYTRAHFPGGTFFFTLVTHDRQPILTHAKSRRLLRHAWVSEMRARPFTLEAICLLPEHLHFIMRLSDDDGDYSTRISGIKARFTRLFLQENSGDGHGSGRRLKGERSVWQHRFWEHVIRDEEELIKYVDYIHFNPVKHGLVTRVADWPWSSFHRYVRRGIYPLDWGGDSLLEKFGNASIGE